MIRILLVDDDALMLQGFKFSIDWEHYGYEIAGTIRNPVLFMKTYQELNPDIVILDINMPGLNGLDLLKELRSLDKELVVIIVSAYNNFTYAREALRLGANDYLLKAEIEFEDILSSMEQYKPQILEKTKYSLDTGHSPFTNQLLFQFREAFTIFDIEKCEEIITRMLTFVQNSQLPKESITQLLLLFYDQIREICTRQIGSFPFNRQQYSTALEDSKDINSLKEYFHKFFTNCCDTLFGKLYSEKQSLLDAVADYALSHLSDPDLTLQKASKTVNVSYYYLSRLFAAEKGISFSKYVTAQRMKQAQEYLLHTDDHIQTIAEKTGYQNLSYFIKKFKEYTGCTPKEFQKKRKSQLEK